MSGKERDALPVSGRFVYRREPDCALVPRKYEPRESRIGGTSGGLGRGARGFWEKVKMGHHPQGCWEWIGYKDKDGYGKFTTTLIDGRSRTYRPHRVAYEMSIGPIPTGMVLMHACDNTACVRPDHLRPGTQSENIRDCYAKGRHPEFADNRGELSGRTKLRNDDVLFIRSQPQAYGLVPVLARLYGVNKQVIALIRCRRTWKHIGNGNQQNAMSLAALRELVKQRERETLLLDEEAVSRRGAA